MTPRQPLKEVERERIPKTFKTCGLQMLQRSGAVPGPISTPEDILHKREVRDKIREIMRTSLGPQEERIVRMHKLENMSIKEVAKKLETTEGRVIRTCQKGMNKLRARIRYEKLKKSSEL